jgi:hypothetical protein
VKLINLNNILAGGKFVCRPYLVNELKTQRILQDRRKVYSLLEECGIPVPPYATVNRDFPYQDVDYLVEEEDYVEICGKRIMKPFVEKPVDGELLLLVHNLSYSSETTK